MICFGNYISIHNSEIAIMNYDTFKDGEIKTKNLDKEYISKFHYNWWLIRVDKIKEYSLYHPLVHIFEDVLLSIKIKMAFESVHAIKSPVLIYHLDGDDHISLSNSKEMNQYNYLLENIYLKLK